MSSNVEDYGVKVSFDNQDFNDNIDSSEKKLNSFQDTLSSFSNSIRNIRFNGNIGLGELINFAAIQTGIYRIKSEIETITDPIETVSDKALKIVSNTMQQALAQIKSGGMQRALNIEAAKFQIEGLKLDVDTFMEAADYAVSGTAYSLDAAAKAASQLGASGITQLEDLKKALRGISGVAAMANSDFDSIAHIFTTVAGQGKLMSMQLQSLSYRGLNVAAELGKALNKSEKEIRDMVSKGQIDFKTFAMAMDDAFGEHAKDANKTFTGAMSNIRAALSRIGEAFATPYIQNMVDVFNQTRLAINELKSELAENYVFEYFAEVVEHLTTSVAKMIEELRYGFANSKIFEEVSYFAKDIFNIADTISKTLFYSGWGDFEQIGNDIAVLVNAAKQLVYAFKEAFDEIFGIKTVISNFKSLALWAASLTHAFEQIDGDEIKEVFKNWLDAIKQVLTAITDVFGITFKSRKTISDMFQNGVKAVLDFVKSLKLSDETIDKLKRTFSGVASVVVLIKDLAFQIFHFIEPLFANIIKLAKNLGSAVLSVLAHIGDFFTELNKAQKEQKTFEKFFNTLKDYFTYILNFTKNVGNAFNEVFFKNTGSEGTSFIDKVFEFIGRVGELATSALNNFSFNGIDFTPIQEFLKNIANFGFSDSEMSETEQGLEKSGNFVLKVLNWIKDVFGNIFSSKKDAESVATQSGSKENKTSFLDTLKNILNWIKDLITTVVENTDPALLAAGALTGLALVIDAMANLLDALFGGIAKIMTIILGFVAENDVKQFIKQRDIFAQMDKLTTAFTKLTNSLPQMIESVKKAVTGFKPLSGIFDSKETFADAIKKILLSFAALIIAIAVGLFAIALIPTADLLKAVGTLIVLSGLITGITIAFAIISKSMSPLAGIGSNPLLGIAATFAIISLALIVIAGSVVMIADGIKGLSIGQIVGVIGIITAILLVVSAILFGYVKLQEKIAVLPSDFLFIGGAFALMGLSIIQIGTAIAAITMAIGSEEGAIGRAWAATAMISIILGVAGTIMAIVASFIKDNPMGGVNALLIGSGIMLMLAGVSSMILSITALLFTLSMMDVEKIEKAGNVLGIILIAIGAITTVLSLIGILAGMSGEMGALGLLALAAVIWTFSELIENLSKPILAISGVLLATAKAIEAVKDLIGYMKDLDAEDAKRVAKNIQMVLIGIGTGIAEAIASFQFTQIAIADELFKRLLNFTNVSLIPFIGKLILSISQPLSEKTMEALINILSTVQTYIPELMDVLYSLFFGPNQILDNVILWLDTLWDRIVVWMNDRIPTWCEDIVGLVLLLISSMNAALDGRWEDFDKEIDALIQGTIKFVKGIITDAKTVADFNSLIESVATLIQNAVNDNKYMVHDAFRDLAGEAIMGFIDGLIHNSSGLDLGIFDFTGDGGVFSSLLDLRSGISSYDLSSIRNVGYSNQRNMWNQPLDFSSIMPQSGKKEETKVYVNVKNDTNSYGIINSIVDYSKSRSRSGSSRVLGY